MSRNRRRVRIPATEPAVPDASPAPPAGARVAGIDALRGGALCLMFVYHFAYDLRVYRVIAADFEHDPFWLGLRAIIVSAFMALVGVSLVLADRAGIARARFWRRIGVIAACAIAVSIASWIAFPHSFIYFGILHSIAVASVLAWPLVRRPGMALVIGCVVIAAGVGWSNPAFDAAALSWLGFVTVKPATADYVPLAPWAGVALLGIALGHRLARDAFRALAPVAAAPGWLRWLGRHSLAVYMVHQPILLGVLWLAFGR
jgi:uncharacterized membrane protein